jgi:hypothetical protein
MLKPQRAPPGLQRSCSFPTSTCSCPTCCRAGRDRSASPSMRGSERTCLRAVFCCDGARAPSAWTSPCVAAELSAVGRTCCRPSPCMLPCEFTPFRGSACTLLASCELPHGSPPSWGRVFGDLSRPTTARQALVAQWSTGTLGFPKSAALSRRWPRVRFPPSALSAR